MHPSGALLSFNFQSDKIFFWWDVLQEEEPTQIALESKEIVPTWTSGIWSASGEEFAVVLAPEGASYSCSYVLICGVDGSRRRIRGLTGTLLYLDSDLIITSATFYRHTAWDTDTDFVRVTVYDRVNSVVRNTVQYSDYCEIRVARRWAVGRRHRTEYNSCYTPGRYDILSAIQEEAETTGGVDPSPRKRAHMT